MAGLPSLSLGLGGPSTATSGATGSTIIAPYSGGLSALDILAIGIAVVLIFKYARR